MQTRGAFVGIIILYTLYFLFNSDELKKKFLNLLVLIIIPIIVFETYYFIRNTNYSSKKNNDIFQPLSISTRLVDNSTSGRLHIWKNAMFMIKEKKINLRLRTSSR